MHALLSPDDKTCIQPDKTCPQPDKTCPQPDKTCIQPDKTCTQPDKTSTQPDKSISSYHIIISYNHITSSYHIITSRHMPLCAKIIQRPKMGRHERYRSFFCQLLHGISSRVQWNGSQTSKINIQISKRHRNLYVTPSLLSPYGGCYIYIYT